MKGVHQETAGFLGCQSLGRGLSEPSWLGLRVLVLDESPQLWCTWRGIHRPASGHSHRHPDALPAWSGEHLPFFTSTRWFSSLCPPPLQDLPILVSAPPIQGRLLTLLDDSSLHLWEIVHQNGCAHLEEGLSFQPPSRPTFDSARYWKTSVGLATR